MTRDGKRGQHHRHRSAQSRPREHKPLAGAEAVTSGHEQGGQRPRDQRDHQREHQPRADRAAELRREHQQPERQEERDLRDPCEALVEGRDRLLRRDARAAEQQTRDVHREEARAAERLRQAECQRGGRA